MPHEPSEEALRVKIGEVDEIPPGKGKTATVGGREITVFNEEGRFVATATALPRRGDLLETTCQMPGRHFDAGHPAHSPDRLRVDEVRYQVQVDDGSVYVLVEISARPA